MWHSMIISWRPLVLWLVLLASLMTWETKLVAGASQSRHDAPAAEIQTLLENHKAQWADELKEQLGRLLREQREVMLGTPVVAAGTFDADVYHKPRSRKLPFLGGALTTALLVLLTWFCWIRYEGNKKVLRQEGEAATALARQDPDTLRKLITDVTHNRTLPTWLAFPDFQRVEWINSMVEQLWPRASAAVVHQVHEQLDPQLKSNKPKWIGDISLPEFNLGSTPPRIKGIKIYPPGQTGDDVVLEVDAVWASSMVVTLKIKLLPERIPILPASINLTSFITKYLSKLVFVKMGVTDVAFSGRVRVVLTGLMDTIPVVSAAQVSLVELPRFSFGIRMLEYLNLMALPGLESFVHYFIRDILLRPFTLPESITIPLVPGATGRHEPPAGMLFVRVVEATNIPNLDWRSLLSKPDCYVELSVRNKITKKTRVIWNKRCPKWDQDFKFLIHFPEHQELLVVLRDYDRLLGSTEVGRARVPIKTLPPGEGEQLWVEVEEAQKGFGSLKGLRSAMDAMRLSHATGQQGARVSQVEDPGGLGFADIQGGAPPVQEIVPPDEQDSDDDASVIDNPTSGHTIQSDQGGATGGAPIRDLRQIAAAPGTCNAGGECCAADEADASRRNSPPPVLPVGMPLDVAQSVSASGGQSSRGRSNGRGAGGASRQSSGLVSAPSTVPESDLPGIARRQSLDQAVAAARKRRGKEPCKVHLDLTYVQVGRDTVEKAKAAGAHAGAEAGSQEAQILSALRGGVLEVKFHRNPSMEDGPPTAKQVVVKVGDREKATEAAGGDANDNVRGLEAEEEILEFVVDGDLADQPGMRVVLKVYDMHWITDATDSPMWTLESRAQMPTEPATVSIPLSDIKDKRVIHKAWQVGSAGVGQTPLLLDVEFEWLPVMDTS